MHRCFFIIQHYFIVCCMTLRNSKNARSATILIWYSGFDIDLLSSVCSPLIICDQFISSARERLAELKQREDGTPSKRWPATSPSIPALKRSLTGAGDENSRPARRKRVSFAADRRSECSEERCPESAADWRQVRALCRRLMAAQALAVSRPSRCTQEWAARAAGVARLARRLTAAVLAGDCGRLGSRLGRLQRLLPILSQLAALAAFSDTGGHVTLASAGVLAALVDGTLATCRRLPAEDALSALSAACEALRSAERSQQRPDQSGQCVDQLDRHQAAALFGVVLPAGNPCSVGVPGTLSSLWQRLARAVGRLYTRLRGRLTADQHSRLAAVRLPRRTPVLRRYLAGDWAGAETRLLAQLDSALTGGKPARRACRPALGLLYLHVAGGRLRRALETADAALLRCAAGSDGATELTAALRHPAGRRLLCSLARLMARYHLAAPLSVPPPHDARPEPPLTDAAGNPGTRMGAGPNATYSQSVRPVPASETSNRPTFLAVEVCVRFTGLPISVVKKNRGNLPFATMNVPGVPKVSATFVFRIFQ